MEFWVTREGKKIKIEDLTDEHIENIVMMFGKINLKASGYDKIVDKFEDIKSKKETEIDSIKKLYYDKGYSKAESDYHEHNEKYFEDYITFGKNIAVGKAEGICKGVLGALSPCLKSITEKLDEYLENKNERGDKNE